MYNSTCDLLDILMVYSVFNIQDIYTETQNCPKICTLIIITLISFYSHTYIYTALQQLNDCVVFISQHFSNSANIYHYNQHDMKHHLSGSCGALSLPFLAHACMRNSTHTHMHILSPSQWTRNGYTGILLLVRKL